MGKYLTKTTEIKIMKQVREMAAARKISAYLILKDGEDVGMIHAYYGSNGRVSVDVYTNVLIHQSKESGCGYNKLAKALDGVNFRGTILSENNWKMDLIIAGFKLIQVI